MTTLAVDFNNIEFALKRIAPYIHTTPLLHSTTLNQALNSNIFLKAENLQKIGAFKIRGALNALLQLNDIQKKQGVIAYSSGNHAQGIAYAAKLLGIQATIIMPEDAPAIKISATKHYDAKVILYNRYTQNREKITQELADQHGLTIIPPFNHPDIIAGQGTCALEIDNQLNKQPLDMLITPLGGGGLLSGCAVAYKKLHPNCQIIGVEPETGNDAQISLRQGKIIRIETPKTIADGVQTQEIGSLTFPILQRYVHDIVTANDQTLINCMNFFASRMKLFVEPTSCLPLAAIIENKIDIRHRKVGIVLSGGNIDPQQFATLIPSAKEIFSL